MISSPNLKKFATSDATPMKASPPSHPCPRGWSRRARRPTGQNARAYGGYYGVVAVELMELFRMDWLGFTQIFHGI